MFEKVPRFQAYCDDCGKKLQDTCFDIVDEFHTINEAIREAENIGWYYDGTRIHCPSCKKAKTS